MSDKTKAAIEEREKRSRGESEKPRKGRKPKAEAKPAEDGGGA